MSRESVSITLDSKKLKSLDSDRGDVPRSRWIERAIEERLKQKENKT